MDENVACFSYNSNFGISAYSRSLITQITSKNYFLQIYLPTPHADSYRGNNNRRRMCLTLAVVPLLLLIITCIIVYKSI